MSPEIREAPTRYALTEVPEKLKVLYFGDSGVGKTTALATLARRGPILFINAEAGIKPTALSRLNIPVENIEVVKAVAYEDLDALLWKLREEFAQDPTRYVGVCIDSITEMQAAMLADELQTRSNRAAAKGMERDPFEVEGADWQRNTESMRRLIRGFRELPCHVGFSALQRKDSDHDGFTTYGPQLTPKVALDLIAYVDIVLAVQPVMPPSRDTGRRRPVYSAFTRRSGKFRAKDRFGILPSTMVDPSFDRVIDYIEGNLTLRDDPRQQELSPQASK